ncbi:accessory gland protein Acp29AB-like [Drosophila elegans]|uniref:accessory gland protein Acp29AB-like n=1 Tax=Drosophila elegans TaxID=30023 RepID=UPI0007E849DC|nr:accessory gland protein Acp29AB-like [Drosophila elegans]
MLMLKIYLLSAFVVLTIHRVGCQDNTQSVYLHSDSQCEQQCLSKLERIEDEQRNILDWLENLQTDRQIQLDAQLLQMELKKRMESQQEEDYGPRLQSQIDVLQTAMQRLQAKMEDQAAAQNKLEGAVMAVQTSLQVLQEKIRFQNPDFSTKPASLVTIIPPGFERIGKGYYYIEHNILVGWDLARSTCNSFGGILASIRDEEELNLIQAKLRRDTHYWIGINDRESEGKFVSLASGEPHTFLKWAVNQPNNLENQDCVTLYNGEMFDFSCPTEYYFICQVDNI